MNVFRWMLYTYNAPRWKIQQPGKITVYHMHTLYMMYKHSLWTWVIMNECRICEFYQQTWKWTNMKWLRRSRLKLSQTIEATGMGHYLATQCLYISIPVTRREKNSYIQEQTKTRSRLPWSKIIISCPLNLSSLVVVSEWSWNLPKVLGLGCFPTCSDLSAQSPSK